jgi:hypothetical protein
MPTFPDIHNTNHRLDVQEKYVLDDSFIRAAGWTGKAFVKARMIWEKNSNDSWQSIWDQLGWLVNPADATMARSVFLGTGSPNYTAVLGLVSFGVKW